MGEPLLNWDAVDTTLTILNQPEGFGIGARHITVSTVGILPNLAKFANRPEQFRLAVSLHAPSPALRRELMPIEKKYTLSELMETLKQFHRRVTLEYVLIGGKNDSLDTADQLAKLAFFGWGPKKAPPPPPPAAAAGCRGARPRRARGRSGPRR